MKLPHHRRAQVPDAKDRDCLLAVSHPVGRFKARLFLALGYESSGWRRLQSDLLALVAANDAVQAGDAPWGRKYTVDGMLGVSSKALVRTVWLVPSNEATPRFVTAYPG